MHINHFQLGEYYGFPKCCVIQFAQEFDNELCAVKRRKQYPQSYPHWEYTGYVPCDNCCIKLINGSITITDLITNRICPDVFPNG